MAIAYRSSAIGGHPSPIGNFLIKNSAFLAFSQATGERARPGRGEFLPVKAPPGVPALRPSIFRLDLGFAPPRLGVFALNSLRLRFFVPSANGALHTSLGQRPRNAAPKSPQGPKVRPMPTQTRCPIKNSACSAVKTRFRFPPNPCQLAGSARWGSTVQRGRTFSGELSSGVEQRTHNSIFADFAPSRVVPHNCTKSPSLLAQIMF